MGNVLLSLTQFMSQIHAGEGLFHVYLIFFSFLKLLYIKFYIYSHLEFFVSPVQKSDLYLHRPRIQVWSGRREGTV